MRPLIFRALAGLAALVMAAGALVLIVMGEPWKALPVVAMVALFGGYALLGEERIQWMFTLLFGIPADALGPRPEKPT